MGVNRVCNSFLTNIVPYNGLGHFQRLSEGPHNGTVSRFCWCFEGVLYFGHALERGQYHGIPFEYDVL